MTPLVTIKNASKVTSKIPDRLPRHTAQLINGQNRIMFTEHLDLLFHFRISHFRLCTEARIHNFLKRHSHNGRQALRHDGSPTLALFTVDIDIALEDSDEVCGDIPHFPPLGSHGIIEFLE